MKRSPAALIAEAQALTGWLDANARQAHKNHAVAPLAEDCLIEFERVAVAGIGAIRVPSDSGGAGGELADLLRVLIALAHGDAVVALNLIPHFLRVEQCLMVPSSSFANDTESESLLRRVANGELIVGDMRGETSIETKVEQRNAHSSLHSPPSSAPHSALRIASDLMHASVDMGIAHAALADAARWVREGVRPVKESGVSRAGDDPFILHTLGRVQAHAQAAETILMTAARTFQAALPTSAFGAAAVTAAEAAALTAEVALLAGQAIFDVGGASTTLRKHGFDRHWRAARQHSLRDPLDQSYRFIGEYLLTEKIG